MNEILTPKETAELLQLSEYTVKEYARQGKIPARKIGGVWRFSHQALLDWFNPGEDFTPEEWAEIRAGQEEMKRSEVVPWEDVRRDV